MEGTLAVMNGAKKHGVKRVVYCGSTAAIFVPPGWNKQMTRFDASMWRDTDSKFCDAYGRSKTFSEQKAWKFVEDLPADQKIELATILPGLVFGPSLVKEKNPSSDIIAGFMTGKIPAAPRLTVPMVDVRDVAEAHLQACLKPEAAGKRFLLTTESNWFVNIGQWIHAKHGNTYGKVCHTEIGDWVINFGGIFSAPMEMMSNMLGIQFTWADEDTKNILGIPGRDVKTSVEEMADCLI